MTPPSVMPNGNYALYRPQGETTLDGVAGEIDEAIKWCRDAGTRGLLADLTLVTGFDPPSVVQRFHFISRWAEIAGPSVVVAVCALPEMVLQDKFGVLVAANRGMASDVFTDITEAETWLTSHVSS